MAVELFWFAGVTPGDHFTPGFLFCRGVVLVRNHTKLSKHRVKRGSPNAAESPPAGRGKLPAAKPVPRPGRLPDFIAPQLCRNVDRPPKGRGWVHEIKFDGYRIQLRVEGGKATLKTRKGLDWTGKFDAIAKAAAGLRDGIIDGEIVALDANGAPDFAALQAALSEGKTKRLIFFAFDLLFE